jgi:hypothetical protein
MLFVFDNAGTPSVARWVRVGADAPAPAVLPDPAPTGPPPAPLVDRTAPRVTLKLTRRGRKLALRVGLSEPGRADVELRLGARRVKRTLSFRVAPRTVTVTRPRGVKRLRVIVRARDTAGNRSTVTRRYATTKP